MDELTQELFSRARGIQATPKRTLIQEDVNRWLPVVMGVTGPPFKAPKIQAGQGTLDDLLKQLSSIWEGRGKHMERLKELMPEYQMPWEASPTKGIVPETGYQMGPEDLAGPKTKLITDKFSEPGASDYYERAMANPEVRAWFREMYPGYDGGAWLPKHGNLPPPPPGPPESMTSKKALEDLLRFLAD